MRHPASVLTIALGLAAGLAGTAEASEQSIRVSGFVSAGNTCEATFTRNPAVIPDVDNVNIKIGGPIGMAPPDPGFWHIDSPTVVMPLAGTGVHVTDFVNGIEYDESNTSVHDGPFVPGTWTVVLLNNTGVPCGDYDNHVKVTFTLIP
jgi:hypothetical protein